MKGQITAFLVRSLRVGCRVRLTYTLRGLMATVILLNLMFFHSSLSGVAAPGLVFFQRIVWINLVFLSLFGLGSFATVITEEREEKTLGLLKMAGLSTVSIILGKSVGRLLDTLLIILAQVPFVLLAVTLGGVSTLQIAAGIATILAWTMLLSGLGLLCSVCLQRSGSATGAMGMVVVPFLLAPIGVEILEQWDAPAVLELVAEPCLQLLTSANPFVASVRIMASGFSGPLIAFQVWSNIIGGVAFVLLAWAGFESLTREERAVVRKPSGLAHRRAFARMQPLRVGRVWSRWALVWKDFHFVGGGWLIALVKIVILGLIFAAALGSVPSTSEALGTMLMVSTFLLGTMLLASLTQKSIGSETQQRTLAGIILLPRSIHAILGCKLLGCLLTLLPELLFFFLATILVPEMIGDLFRSPIQTIVWLVVQAVFILNLAAYFTLVVKRGAVALALITWWLVLQFFFAGLTLPFIDYSYFLYSIVGPTIVAGVLYSRTLKRLQSAAADVPMPGLVNLILDAAKGNASKEAQP